MTCARSSSLEHARRSADDERRRESTPARIRMSAKVHGQWVSGPAAAIRGMSIAPSRGHASARPQVRPKSAARTQGSVGKNTRFGDAAPDPAERSRPPGGLRPERSCSPGAPARQVRDPHRACNRSHHGRLEPARRSGHGLPHQARRERPSLRARRGTRARRGDCVRAGSLLHREGDGAIRRTRANAHSFSHAPLASEATRAEITAGSPPRRRQLHRTARRKGAGELAASGSSSSRTTRRVDRHLAARSERDGSQGRRRFDRGPKHQAAHAGHGLHAGGLCARTIAKVDAEEREPGQEREQDSAPATQKDPRAEGPREARPSPPLSHCTAGTISASCR